MAEMYYNYHNCSRDNSKIYTNCLYSPSGELVRGPIKTNDAPGECRVIQNNHPYNPYITRGCDQSPPTEKPLRKEPDCYKFKSLEDERAYVADTMRGYKPVKWCDPRDPKSDCNKLRSDPALGYKANQYNDTCVEPKPYGVFQPRNMPEYHNKPYNIEPHYMTAGNCNPFDNEQERYYNIHSDYDGVNNFY
jgi:hypothetical protein